VAGGVVHCLAGENPTGFLHQKPVGFRGKGIKKPRGMNAPVAVISGSESR